MNGFPYTFLRVLNGAIPVAFATGIFALWFEMYFYGIGLLALGCVLVWEKRLYLRLTNGGGST